MAADSGHVVSDVPVGRVTGHIDAILGHACTVGISRFFLAGIVEFVLETHGQNVDQLRQRKKKHIIIMRHRNVSHLTNYCVTSPHWCTHTHLLKSIGSALLPSHRDIEHIGPCRNRTEAWRCDDQACELQ